MAAVKLKKNRPKKVTSSSRNELKFGMVTEEPETILENLKIWNTKILLPVTL